jgi:hypothetical protein
MDMDFPFYNVEGSVTIFFLHDLSTVYRLHGKKLVRINIKLTCAGYGAVVGVSVADAARPTGRVTVMSGVYRTAPQGGSK